MDLGYMHDAITKAFSYGVCVHQGDCDSHAGSDRPRLDMRELKSPLTWATMGWWNHIRKLVEAHSNFLSLIIIAIESLRFCTFIFLRIQSSMLHVLQCLPEMKEDNAMEQPTHTGGVVGWREE